MGGSSSYTADDWTNLHTRSATYAKASTATAAFKARGLDPYLDPKTFQIRESRNSALCPAATPLIVALDVTGSMGDVAHKLASSGLSTLIKEVFERKPIPDAQIMFQCIGDVKYDDAPLQVSQFEADLRMVDQLDKIWVEGGGGGNRSEGYNLAWHLAAFHTSCDAFEKDGRKGFLFTVGDERCPPDLTADDLMKVYGRGDEVVATNGQLLEILADRYHVFHLIVEEGGGYRMDKAEVLASWKFLGQRAIPLTDYTKLAEVIVSIMQVVAGEDAASVSKSWSGDTSLVVANATRNLSVQKASGGAGSLVRFGK